MAVCLCFEIICNQFSYNAICIGNFLARTALIVPLGAYVCSSLFPFYQKGEA